MRRGGLAEEHEHERRKECNGLQQYHQHSGTRYETQLGNTAVLRWNEDQETDRGGGRAHHERAADPLGREVERGGLVEAPPCTASTKCMPRWIAKIDPEPNEEHAESDGHHVQGAD